MNETTKEFRDKLFALCREYGVEMEVVENTSGWNPYVEGVNFFSYTVFGDDHEVVRESVDLTLPCKEFFNE